jgi:hypothetical protein
VRILSPEITAISEAARGSLSSVRTRFVVFEYRVCCTVAPRKESSYTTDENLVYEQRLVVTRDPRPPESRPSRHIFTYSLNPSAMHALFSTSRSRTIVSPIKPPPAIETAVPSNDIPPFVPGGTVFKVVMSMGLDFERMPSSEARVSPRQHPNCPSAARTRKRLQPFPNSDDNAHVVAGSYRVLLASREAEKPKSHAWVNEALHARHATNAGNELQKTCVYDCGSF